MSSSEEGEGGGGTLEGGEPLLDPEALEALEFELGQMGLTVDDLVPPDEGRFDRRAMARMESAQLLSRKFIERDAIKASICAERHAAAVNTRALRERMVRAWEAKTARSPFRVNLLAEQERVDEENRVRLVDEARRAALLEARQRAARDDIILGALSEASDLEALRREKRAIIEEERRLKALLDLEKTNGHRKAQMLAAHKAEKQRHATKAAYRRSQFTHALADHNARSREALRFKHDVPHPPDNTFTSFEGRPEAA